MGTVFVGLHTVNDFMRLLQNLLGWVHSYWGYFRVLVHAAVTWTCVLWYRGSYYMYHAVLNNNMLSTATLTLYQNVIDIVIPPLGKPSIKCHLRREITTSLSSEVILATHTHTYKHSDSRWDENSFDIIKENAFQPFSGFLLYRAGISQNSFDVVNGMQRMLWSLWILLHFQIRTVCFYSRLFHVHTTSRRSWGYERWPRP